MAGHSPAGASPQGQPSCSRMRSMSPANGTHRTLTTRMGRVLEELSDMPSLLGWVGGRDGGAGEGHS